MNRLPAIHPAKKSSSWRNPILFHSEANRIERFRIDTDRIFKSPAAFFKQPVSVKLKKRTKIDPSPKTTFHLRCVFSGRGFVRIHQLSANNIATFRAAGRLPRYTPPKTIHATIYTVMSKSFGHTPGQISFWHECESLTQSIQKSHY